MDWLTLLLVIGGPILVGVILLVIEYRTKWFANYLQHRRAPDDSDELAAAVVGQTVTPLEQQEPVADWLRIAQEVQVVLEKVFAAAAEGPIVLLSIKPQKQGLCELRYRYADKQFEPGYVCTATLFVTIDPAGRIIECHREG